MKYLFTKSCAALFLIVGNRAQKNDILKNVDKLSDNTELHCINAKSPRPSSRYLHTCFDPDEYDVYDDRIYG